MQIPDPPEVCQSVAGVLLRAGQQPSVGTMYLGQRVKGGPIVRSYQSNSQLLNAAMHLMGAMRERGHKPQSTVVLMLDDHQDFITCLWACFLGGLVPCPMVALPADPARWETALGHVQGLLEGPLVVTTEATKSQMPAVPGLEVVTVETLRRHRTADCGSPHNAASDDLALLVLTSGSTGSSKAVALTHANLLASMAGKQAFQCIGAADTTLNWISFDHVAALLETHLLPLYAGARQIHVPSDIVVDNPLEFLRIISRDRVSMTFTPNFLLAQLNALADSSVTDDASGEEQLDLSCLRHIVSGGEANLVATGQAFLKNFARHGLRGALWPAFGMTETCAGCIYNRDFPLADAGEEFASVGHAIPGLDMRVGDNSAQAVPEGEVGDLQLRGPMITRGYFGNEQATAEAFTADGWFRTGDLGHIRDGRLTLVGRSKDSIVVNGVSYYSHEIETAIEELEGTTRGYVAAFPTRRAGSDTEQLVVAVATEPDQDEAERHRRLTAVRSTAVLTCGFRPGLVLPLPKSAFPKTSLGKTLRLRMRQRLESGGYDDIIAETAAATVRQRGGYTPPTGDTEAALAQVYADMFDMPVEEISATTSFFDLGGTSLDVLRLRQQVSQRLDIDDLPIITLLSAPSIRQLSDRLNTADDDRSSAYDPIVPLQTVGAKTPLFCVHPGVGEVLVFVNLAKYFIGERPFYALRARGFNHGETPFTSFAEMVGSYVSAIRMRQPHGPYAIAGYSYGAAVAFEIAKELESAGERVDFVGSFNLPPHIKYRMDELDFTETATNLAMFLELITKSQATYLPSELSGRPKQQQLSHLLQLAPAGRVAELDLDLGKFTAWAELAHGLTNLGRTYTPTGTVRSMTVFCAIPLRGTKQDWIDNELRRWDEFTTEPNRYIDVPGEHYTLMGARHVAAFQAILRKELDRALPDFDE